MIVFCNNFSSVELHDFLIPFQPLFEFKNLLLVFIGGLQLLCFELLDLLPVLVY